MSRFGPAPLQGWHSGRRSSAYICVCGLAGVRRCCAILENRRREVFPRSDWCFLLFILVESWVVGWYGTAFPVELAKVTLVLQDTLREILNFINVWRGAIGASHFVHNTPRSLERSVVFSDGGGGLRQSRKVCEWRQSLPFVIHRLTNPLNVRYERTVPLAGRVNCRSLRLCYMRGVWMHSCNRSSLEPWLRRSFFYLLSLSLLFYGVLGTRLWTTDTSWKVRWFELKRKYRPVCVGSLNSDMGRLGPSIFGEDIKKEETFKRGQQLI